ncbi:maltose/maltodextrin ABC transporter, permease protein malG [Halarchaeum acidiphilum MH1-52-1]|uniref:Maltose/maltodextrin ABC transporter, permease protein malG n=1 Tax=Halarchaeum acidiphilum MH1-52-1 TaxID=1261545 RepID=U2YVS6_9EURY|nr:carbohydrate ABC transporter permease [Halarchaeum acidiphilum]GAD52857.1 maltose/maltodextrin ABC transporter, permease protein malG [Halarchaeum acidiphilum MH1-52-1]
MSTENESYERISYESRQRFWNVVESRYVVHIVLALAVLTVIVPIVWELLTSFKANDAVYNLTYLPRDPTLSSYYEVLIGQQYWKALLNSLIISTVTTIVVMGLATPAGYAFSRYRFRGDNVIFIGVLFSRLFPPIGLIVPYYQIMSWLGLLNTLPGIIMAEVYLWLPLMIYIMRNFFMSIPADLDESARVDGCTRLQAFRKIALPLAAPGIAACSILTFLYSWREFLFSLIVTTDLQSMPISVAVYKFVGDVSVQWASLAAASVIAVVPTILIVVFFQRYIVSGLTAGALKE